MVVKVQVSFQALQNRVLVYNPGVLGYVCTLVTVLDFVVSFAQ